ncbi:MAG: SRPBCC domain-containing protein [Bacteroidales bacterium]|nr:SRPBCC domain-containing protein [Bacteroidales bacterium]
MKKKITLEYTLNSSPKILFSRLSTPGGLSEWFADDVNVNGNTYTFFWEGEEYKADIVQKRENKYIRFRWHDAEDQEASCLEFRVSLDELTGDVALIITDFVDEDDQDSEIELWDSQVGKLKHVLGL